MRDTLNLIHDLAERGVGVPNLADPIKVDSTKPDDPMAQLAVVLLALFAQMERTHLLERAAHTRSVATAEGRRIKSRLPAIGATTVAPGRFSKNYLTWSRVWCGWRTCIARWPGIAEERGLPAPCCSTIRSVVAGLDPGLVTMAHQGAVAYCDGYEPAH